MKFTKFLMAAMAAMAIVSCSKEVETLSPDTPLAPGDARITFAIGSKSTTYASAADEKKIESMKVFLVYENGATPTVKVVEDVSVKYDMATNNFKHTLADGSYKPGSTATLYFAANSEVTLPADEDFTKLKEEKDIYSIVGDSLAINKGLTAYKSFDVLLKAGTINASSDNAITGGKVILQRMAARLYAAGEDADGKAADIKGYSVTFTGMASGATFADMTGLDKTGTPVGKYTITGKTAGQFKGEAVGYFYPVMNDQSPVTITVTGRDNLTTRTATFFPMPNKNYKLTIIPSKDDSSLDFDLEIGDWDGNEGDGGNVDFTNPAIKLNPVYNEDGVLLKDGVLEVTPKTTNLMTIDLSKVVTVDGLGETLYIADTELKEGARGLVPGIVSVTIDEIKMVTIEYATNYSKNALEFNLFITAFPKDETRTESLETRVPMVIKPHAILPEGFLVDMGAAGTYAAINTQGDLASDIVLFNKVNAPTTGTFSDKMIAYLKASPASYAEVVGKKFANKTTAVTTGCPKGFKIPAKSNFKQLLANTFNFASSFTMTNPTQYNVRARGVMENITNGAGALVTEDYKVGIFNTDFPTGGDLANKSYRVLDHNGKSIVVIVTNTLGNGGALTSFGGLYTTDGNIGIGGSSTSSTIYTNSDGGNANMQVRCIKDDAAANVIW